MVVTVEVSVFKQCVTGLYVRLGTSTGTFLYSLIISWTQTRGVIKWVNV